MKRQSYALATGLFAVLLATGVPAFAGTAPNGAHGTSGNGGPAAQDSSVLGATALEVNGATWDPNFTDAAVPGLLSKAGVGLVRWPGGSYSDTYDWQTNSPGGDVPFGQFMNEIAAAHAAPFITVNYAQTSLGPPVASAWVKDAQTYANYSDQTALWEVGNENYGPWEADTHPAPHTPRSYATYALPYFTAMHAADPKAQIGFPYTLTRSQSAGTGTWVPDPAAWNDTVLQKDGSQIDFADVHWYPVFGNPALTPAQIMATVRTIPAAMQSVKSTLNRYDPKAYVIAGESNISQSGITANEQPIAALYAAATALEFLSHGARSYGWWDIHNTPNMDQDFGFLSSGGTAPGPFTTALATTASKGALNLPARGSTDNFTVGHTITIGTGTGTGTATGTSAEHREITALGGNTTLSAPANRGQDTVDVTDVAPFAPGAPVTIGTGSTAQRDTVTAAGTGASSTSLVAPATAGQSVIRVEGTALGGQSTPVFMPPGFAPGAQVRVGTGSTAETATVKSVGTSSSLATTTASATPKGATTIHVTSVANNNTGVAFYVGDPVVIGGGANPETDTITSVGTSGADGTGITLAKPLANSYAGGTSVQDAGTGITLTKPLARAHAAGETAATPGTGIRLAHPLTSAEAAGTPAASTGITVTPALGTTYPAGTTVTDPGQREPALDTPMPAYDGYELASLLTTPGARLTALPTSDPSLFAFASTSGGKQAVLLVNADAVHSRVLRLPQLAGGQQGQPVTTYTYSLENPSIVKGSAPASALARGVTLPPESIEVLRP
jgi:hypothetical protein